ncbi:MAG: FIG00003370: Multicopper polyphenol oxidase [uncultured Solirubrobacteraceae bacterium]|uniref:FIG00003370: Multicopper polyphenol oxidase n=1 Tax=uncultured Solirubrobacteraceae bacterium TaxID=1162706 RepID=A0A6J4SIQ2_9ACTN|nr:MAG: FIG00003370: Multicopper polyphenol oxidase [uncultured Solirubrobacteraceae bacterium]
MTPTRTGTDDAHPAQAPVEPTLPEPFHWQGWHIGATLPGGRVLFTTRRGGASSGPHAEMNLSRSVGDDRAAVDVNRERLAAQIGFDWSEFSFGRQVHGTTVRRVVDAGAPRRVRGAEEDGQATALEDNPALVLVADCLPVALVAAGAVAVLHAGWRGLSAGIVEEGISALRECGASGAIVAALGPSARPCCYEVGEEVHAHFPEPGARSGDRGLDLAAVARARLGAGGVEEVHDVGLCTMCAPELFFSHRRDAGVTGRQAGVAWRAG